MSETAFGAVSLGLTASVAWGAADFTGGVITKRTNVYGVVIGAELVGLLLLFPFAIILREPVPALGSWLMAGLAGICGGFGLILLYRALAGGQMSVAAPVSALMGAAIPVLVGTMLEGFPKGSAMAGIGLALVAILLISLSADTGYRMRFNLAQLALPLAAGVIFGLFFVLMHQASQTARLWPIIATRLASVAVLSSFALATRQARLPERRFWPLITVSGILDTGGNVFYVFAGQLGRLDIAAVLSSLYPASTVLLAWLILKERVTTIQTIGILVALLAILLIVL